MSSKKVRNISYPEPDGLQPDDLLINLIEQVKLPFVQIAYAAELMEGLADPEKIETYRQSIDLSSQAALRLIDGYLLSVALQRREQLELEPVSISSVLYDTAHMLTPYARAHNCELQLRVDGKYGPVMAHRQAVQSALVALSYSFIESAADQKAGKMPIVTLGVSRVKSGITTGVYSGQAAISKTLFARAKRMHGKTHQPIGDFDSGNGAGIFIADALFAGLQSQLRVARFKGLAGLSATLTPSRQLNLI